MALKQITAPTNPVTLAEAKAHLRLTHSADDDLIAIYLAAALAHIDGVEGYLGRSVATQTWELSYDAFPSGPIALPLPPLQSIESVKYYDDDGLLQTMDADDYVVDAVSAQGWILPTDSWPSTFSTANAVVIRFVAGLSPTPATIKAAILMRVQAQYEGDTASAKELVLAAERYEAMHRANLGA